MVDLHPIVIPSLEHRFRSVTYTCSGEGLCKDGYIYDAHAEKLIPPKGHKPGNTRDIETKPAGWWRAQCAFRGLNQSGSIADLQLRLREAKKKMIPELKTAETQLNQEFKKRNRIARDSNWKDLKTAEQKAEANPQRYLSEAFPKRATGRPANLDVIIVKTENRSALAEAADKLGLESVSVDAPWIGNIPPSPDRWIIIGRSRDAVWNQMRDIERAARSQQDTSLKVKEKQTLKHSASGSILPPQSFEPKPSGNRTKQTARKYAPSTGTHDSLFDETEAHTARQILPLPRKKQTARKFAPSTKARKKQTARKFAPSTSTHDNLFADSGSHTMRPPPTEALKKQTARKFAPSTSTHPRICQKKHELRVVSLEPSQALQKSENSWNVRGSYVIECPDIEDEWGEKDAELTLDIYVEKKGGRKQMFAMFNFIVVEGIMRFERPTPAARSQNESGKRKREHSYMDEDGDVLMDDIPQYDTEERAAQAITQKAHFSLKDHDHPTARRPTWGYRWRGEETGEGEIQLGSDRTLESITFSNNGKELSGTFKCDFAGKCNFTGLKVMSRPHDSRIEPEAEWAKRSEDAHSYARQARWR
ncbi:hypothetical protein EYC84_003382 [Monilinia fructicola]|uniref:Uncharacterized protein n=1 Tax=Monilinia fructicola TaxID=38448 RepID=A0A5M9K1L8_MONFR|nr:hypothetical protein EYC84_003382 [Monilinia fructicola]